MTDVFNFHINYYISCQCFKIVSDLEHKRYQNFYTGPFGYDKKVSAGHCHRRPSLASHRSLDRTAPQTSRIHHRASPFGRLPFPHFNLFRVWKVVAERRQEHTGSPHDLIAMSRMSRTFRDNAGQQRTGKIQNVYFCLNKACLDKKVIRFQASQLILPPATKAKMTAVHVRHLQSTMKRPYSDY